MQGTTAGNRLIRAVLVAALVLPAAATAERASAELQVTDWAVPWEQTRPRDPDFDAEGRVWFVGQRGDYVGVLTPESGEFRRYELPPGTGPHNLIVANDGGVWFAGNRAAYIGRLDPETGDVRKYPMPDPRAQDPHTLAFDQAGDIWFTVQHGNFLGKLEVVTGEIQLLSVPTERARPYGIVVDQHSRPWAVLLGSNKLATVDPETMALTEIALPREEARPRRLALTGDGAVWYVDHAAGHLGRYAPDGGTFREWRAPGGEAARPYAMAVDGRDRVWFVESGPQPNRLVGFDPDSGTFFAETELARSGGSTRHMVHNDGVLWFGLDTDHITRVVLPH